MLRTSRTFAAAPRVAPLLVALAGGATVALGAGGASGAGPATVQVAVTAPAGKGCISSEKLQSAVQKRVGGESKKGGRSAAAFVQIASADPGPGWVAEVAIAGQAGRRSVRTSAAACSQLDEGLVLVVTLLASPGDDEDPPPGGDEPAPSEKEPGGGSAWGRDTPSPADEPEPEEPESEEPGPGAKKPAAPAEPKDGPGEDKPSAGNKASANKGSPGDEATKKKAPKEDADEPERKVQFGVGLGAVYSSGLLPWTAGGVRGSFSWLSPTPVPLEASFTVYPSHEHHEIVIEPEGLHEVGVMALGVTACPATVGVGRLSFGACAGLSTTRYAYSFHSDQELPGYEEEGGGPQFVSADFYLLSTTAELRFDVTLWKMLRVGAAVEAAVPLNRPGMVDWLHSMNLQALNEPVIFQSRLGISLVLPP